MQSIVQFPSDLPSAIMRLMFHSRYAVAFGRINAKSLAVKKSRLNRRPALFAAADAVKSQLFPDQIAMRFDLITVTEPVLAPEIGNIQLSRAKVKEWHIESALR